MVEDSVKTWDGKWVSDPAIQIPSTVEYAKIDQQLGYINKTLGEDDLFDTSFYARRRRPEDGAGTARHGQTKRLER